MGLVKLALFSTAGYLAFRSVSRVCTLVKPCKIPQGSLLDLASGRKSGPSSAYADAFQRNLQTPVTHRPRRHWHRGRDDGKRRRVWVDSGKKQKPFCGFFLV